MEEPNPCPKCGSKIESTQSTNERGIGTYFAFCNNCNWCQGGMLDDD